MIFVDLDFYKTEYIAGGTQLIPDEEFPRWERDASVEIIDRTFGRAEYLEEIPDRLMFCVCAVAELLFSAAEANNHDGLQSERIGEWSGTYRDQRMDKRELNRAIQNIVDKWLRPLTLDGVPLLYPGV